MAETLAYRIYLIIHIKSFQMNTKINGSIETLAYWYSSDSTR